MKNTIKYTFLSALFLGFTACDVDNTLTEIKGEAESSVALQAGSADFSNYVSIGASFTAGFTDGALFKAGQQYSFPNTLASKFALVGGGEFVQPLMNDNIGGLVLGGNIIQEPRFYFNGSGPTRLDKTPTTNAATSIATATGFNNMGLPGAKSFHLTFTGYGMLNPYFGRMTANPATATVIGDAVAKAPTFFTLSEIGGNDVLGYAVSGGTGVNQSPTDTNPTGNLDPSTYGANDITNPLVFNNVFNGIVSALEATGAKGVVANLPYITSLPHFTTVPYAPLDPSNAEFGAQIPLLNTVYGAINQIYVGAGEPERAIVFSETAASPVVIEDEKATDLTNAITTNLSASPTFVPFVESLGLPAAAAPLVAQLLGKQYGKARSATENDLLVLPSSAVIGKVNNAAAADLIAQSGGLLPATLAGQFSAEGVTLPLEDKWVLTPEEQAEIKAATDAYNETIKTVAEAKGYAFVDFNAILQEASTTGLEFGRYNMNTSLITGGLIGLDGIHLTSRGYALMANKMLAAIDAAYGSNFTEGKDGLAKPDDYPTNYSPTLQ